MCANSRKTTIWHEVVVENQRMADERIPELRQTPGLTLIVRCEPLLGAVDLSSYFRCRHDHNNDGDCRVHRGGCTRIGWVRVGGEVGLWARPTHPQWVRDLRDQCVSAHVPFCFSQWGEWSLIQRDEPVWRGDELVYFKDSRPNAGFGVLAPDGEWYHQHTGWNGRPIDPDTGEAYMVRVGLPAAGRLLDGREWNEFPHAKREYKEYKVEVDE